ncbi:MAG: DUF2156 domain-containing protein [Anaerolineales bacterium]|nr:DUF2156 domain-containing protein [Anaerolineales bacterium]MCB9128025.1 DUF2156 domain-containing protein [Ardenticatenales bacterium]MCB9172041.1 DUF2156 domain-containing protein [Ardenticatenales bacterium]
MTATLSPDEARLRQLVMRYGYHSTSYQLLAPGMRHWFDTGEGAVGYVDRARTRVVAGAPVGPVERLPALWQRFVDETTAQGHRLCVVGAEQPFAQTLAGRGDLTLVKIGAQPVWQPAQWAALVNAHSSLRSQVNRAQNKAVRVAEWTTSIAEMAPLQRCKSRWMAAQPLPPLHFLTEPDLLDRLLDRRLFVARQRNRVVAFLLLAPIPQRHGWLTELSVRDPDAPNGTMSLLLHRTISQLALENAQMITLGAVPLSELGDAPFAEPLPRWASALRVATLRWGARLYNVKGLEAFKAKFHPQRWEPIYLISYEARLSPRTLYAVAAAYSGGTPWRFAWQTLRR